MSTGSISLLIDAVKTGDGGAACRLWERYFPRVRRYVDGKFAENLKGPADEEDVALSAMAAFFRGAEQGQFEQLDDRDQLWRLLRTIASRKLCRQVKHETTHKRNGVRASDIQLDFDVLAASDPAPEQIAMLFETHQRLFQLLPEEPLQNVAELLLDGRTIAEIADRLGLAQRTIHRKLKRIRSIWRKELDR